MSKGKIDECSELTIKKFVRNNNTEKWTTNNDESHVALKIIERGRIGFMSYYQTTLPPVLDTSLTNYDKSSSSFLHKGFL